MELPHIVVVIVVGVTIAAVLIAVIVAGADAHIRRRDRTRP